MTQPGRPLVMSSGKLAHTKPAPSRPSSLIPSPRIQGSHPGPGGSRQSRKSLRSPPDAPARDNDAMASELIRCGHCGQANRVPAAAAGTPRCGKCHQPLPWIADADDTTFGDVAEAVIEHGTRRIRVLGATEHPVQSWVMQQARNLLMDLEDAGIRAKFILHDRDASLTATFDSVFQTAGIRVIRSAVQAPRMNSVMERWIGSCRRELLDRTLVWNQRHLMIVLREYEDFYNTHRPHRTLNQAAPLRPLPDGVTDLDQIRIQRRDRTGGVIHEYRLVA